MKGAPRSKEFDDIYFSQDDGLAETAFVFLKGNDLPEAWEGKDHFTIAETGFGTGLNFLATWDLFEKTALKAQRLDFISFEQYPLSVEEIREVLAPWGERFEGKIDRFLDLYPLRIPGVHSVCLSENVFLTLLFDDINESLPTLSGYSVDTWFLDGFTPAKNPQMWTETVFHNMARLSHDQTRFATFTASGEVKRGLQKAGFDVEKTAGFGRKRERLVGHLNKGRKREIRNTNRSVAIIGGGLAGTACAYWFKKQGLSPVIFEQSPSFAAEASGNERGMVNPRLSKLRNSDADFYMQGFAMAVREMKQLSHTHDIDFHPCGALHLMHNADMEIRYPATVQNWGWHEDHARIVSAAEASEIAGIPLERAALYLPDAASVNPRKLCEAYAFGVETHFNTKLNELMREGDRYFIEGRLFDAVILANGSGVKAFKQAKELPLYTVRGQMSMAQATPETYKLKTILNYRGYLSPAFDGLHALGSTFDRETLHTQCLGTDDQEIFSYMEATIPSLKGVLMPHESRASLRVSSKYRFPMFAEIAPNLYVSTAHGSHGLVSTLQCARLIFYHMYIKNP